MALAKCFDRTRSGEVEREEEAAAPTEVLLDSTLARLAGRRADFFGDGLERFLDALLATFFRALTFKRTDLARADGRLAAFFVGLDFAFAFVAIGARNLYEV